MLIDLHAHSSGISRCCRIPARQVLEVARSIGLDGIVLTNHYQKNYVTDGDLTGFVRRYMEEICYVQKLAEEMNMKAFWGIEVTMELYPGVHMLVYGVGEDFLEKHPAVFDMTQEELWHTVKAEGGVLIQGHPYRGVTSPLEPRWLDGVEINCHPLYGNTYSTQLLALAQKHGLIVTCGGDYHADTYRAHCGTFLPEHITDSVALGRFLQETDEIELLVQEIPADTLHRIRYCRGTEKE